MRGVIVFHGVPGATTKITVADAAGGFADAIKYRGGTVQDNRRAIAIYLQVEAFAARIAFGGTTPVPGTNTGHLLGVGDKIRLENWKFIDTASFINEAGGSAAIFNVTAEY